MGLERLRGAYRSTFVQVMALGTAIKIVKALHLFSHPVCTDWSMSSTSQQVTAMGRIEMGCHVRSPGPWRVQGQGAPPRPPRLRRAPGAGLPQVVGQDPR